MKPDSILKRPTSIKTNLTWNTTNSSKIKKNSYSTKKYIIARLSGLGSGSDFEHMGIQAFNVHGIVDERLKAVDGGRTN